MHNSTPAIEAFISKAIAGSFDLQARFALSEASGLLVPEFCNAVALTVARRFDGKLMGFDHADAVMNEVCALLIHHANAMAGNVLELAEPAWSIYLAFDEGEYDHRDGADPVQKHTVPMVKRVLDSA